MTDPLDHDGNGKKGGSRPRKQLSQAEIMERAARQAAKEPDQVEAEADVEVRVLRLGDGRISMGIHVPGKGDAFYERGETFTLSKSRAIDYEERGWVEIV